MAGFLFLPWFGAYRFGSSAPEIDFCERAKERLIYQFKNKTNLEAYLCALAKEFQDLETVLQTFKQQRTLDNAVGAQLDNLGDLLGLARKGLSDDDYRTALRNQIILNGGSGTPESVAFAVKTLTEATTVKIVEEFPAKIVLYTDGPTLPTDIINLIENAVPAGVGVEVVATYASALPFTFDSDPGETPESGLNGFSEPNYIPDAGKGGTLNERFV